jgi:hypothetical protein
MILQKSPRKPTPLRERFAKNPQNAERQLRSRFAPTVLFLIIFSGHAVRGGAHQRGRIEKKEKKIMNSKRTNRISKLTMSSLIGLFLMSGIFASTALAKPKVVVRTRPVVVVHTGRPVFWHRRYDPFWVPSVTYRVVDDNRHEGFEEGRDQGKKDAKKGHDYDPKGSKDYFKSDSFSYREGFLRGYDVGYRSERD